MFAQFDPEPIFEVIFGAIAFVISVIVLVAGGAGCLGFCLGAVSAYIIYRIAYKSPKHPPPASDNDENPKD